MICFLQLLKVAEDFKAIAIMSSQALDFGGAIERKSLAVDDDGRPTRRGNQWTALAHVITAVSGAGVLSLSWSLCQIGWVAGPVILLLLALSTLYASVLLSDCYRSPDPVTGNRNYTYSNCVNAILGKRAAWICALAQNVDLYGATVAYTIVASSSMASLAQSVCYQKHDANDYCTFKTGRFMLVFGGIQILLSQLQDMHKVWWLSTVSTLMSFSYSFILLALSATTASEHGHSHGTAFGMRVSGEITPYQKTLRVFQAIGNMSYSFLFTSVLIEIQDTLRSSPPESKTMRKAISIGVIYTTIFYMALGGMGYAAYGDSTPGNLLLAMVSYRRVFWIVDLANLFIIIQIMGAYQVNAQPIYAFVEDHAARYIQRNRKTNIEQLAIIGHEKYFISKIDQHTIFRIVWRTGFVILTTLISMAFPFFNAILGLLGALAYWPLTIYFPVRMHMKQFNVHPWSAKWIALQLFVLSFLLVSCSSIAGSVQGILQSMKDHQSFHI